MIAVLPTQERVNEVVQKLAPDVVRIRFLNGRDWTDDPAFYFRVILSDEASKRERLPAVTRRVRQTVSDELGLDELEHHSYFKFRSQSEQEKLKSTKWE